MFRLRMFHDRYDTISDEVRGSGYSKDVLKEILERESPSMPTTTSASTQASTPTTTTVPQPQSQQIGSTQNVLGQYLFNQRWVWSMNINPTTSFDVSSIAEILNTILK